MSLFLRVLRVTSDGVDPARAPSAALRESSAALFERASRAVKPVAALMLLRLPPRFELADLLSTRR
jgi:hypothetical protein